MTFGIVSNSVMRTTEWWDQKNTTNSSSLRFTTILCRHGESRKMGGQEACMFRIRPLGVARDPPFWVNTCFLLLGNTRMRLQRAPSHTCFIHSGRFGESGRGGLYNLGLNRCFSGYCAAQMPLFPFLSGRWKRRLMGSRFTTPQPRESRSAQIDIFV